MHKEIKNSLIRLDVQYKCNIYLQLLAVGVLVMKSVQ